MTRPAIVVTDYDSHWPEVFESLRSRASAVLGHLGSVIEHVGSTSVPGLAAKPVIDIGVVVTEREDIPTAIEKLTSLGYVHRGNLGVEDREAFTAPPELPSHNLYLYVEGSLPLRNHRALRDYLRANSEAAHAYGELKKRLAAQHADNIDAYVDGKTGFILEILEMSGFSPTELERIADVNRLNL